MNESQKKYAVIIPARLNSTRLPRKMLADIHGKPMIVWTLMKALEADIGDVFVACAEDEIAKEVEANGGVAILTDPDLPTGSDRIHAALVNRGISNYDFAINLQGDLPHVEPEVLRVLRDYRNVSQADIVTVAARINDFAELEADSVVKIAMKFYRDQPNLAKALYFSRSIIPHYGNQHFHHVGIYAFKVDSLCRYVKLEVSELELAEKLEQIRALEDGMTIDVGMYDYAPFGVDTREDLERAREILKSEEYR